jgi:hypothetical protein
MNKQVKYYERILKKKVEMRTGTDFEEWLEPQLHAAALCWQMLEKVQEEIMDGKMMTEREGVKGQKYNEVNPLLSTYKELQRTIIQHYEALGLNYKATPSKIKEDTNKGVNAKKDGLVGSIQAVQSVMNEVPE